MKFLTVGKCCLCPKTIWKFHRPSFISRTQYGWSLNFKKRPYELNEDGEHFWILCTDGSRMMVAICKSCLEAITDEQVKKVFSDIIYTKLEQIKKDNRGDDIKYKLFDRIRDIQVWAWARTEKEIIQYLSEKNGKEHNTADAEQSAKPATA